MAKGLINRIKAGFKPVNSENVLASRYNLWKALQIGQFSSLHLVALRQWKKQRTSLKLASCWIRTPTIMLVLELFRSFNKDFRQIMVKNIFVISIEFEFLTLGLLAGIFCAKLATFWPLGLACRWHTTSASRSTSSKIIAEVAVTLPITGPREIATKNNCQYFPQEK